jgi:hypothetical protein
MKKCLACDGEYEYYTKGDYPGKNPSFCPACQLSYEERGRTIVGNQGHRPAGHNTRGIHKRVHLEQL